MRTLLDTMKSAWTTVASLATGTKTLSTGAATPTVCYSSIRPAVASAASGTYDSLLHKAMGDRSLVERLVGYEFRRCSDLSRSEAIERANRRWERDVSR